MRRTVWDGDQEFYEIQAPDSGYAEEDGPIPELPLTGSPPFDPNPFFGRVGYTHGLGLDQPLGILRSMYTDRISGVQDSAATWRPDPFAIFPLWTLRGEPEFGTYEDGALERCATVNGLRRCVRGYWPGHWFTTERPKVRRNAWHGTLVEDKRDETGTFYRRNRYLDPLSGRFTQEDPIGLAGGINLYGFAEGDAVGYSDPYGLCPQKLKDEQGACPGGLSEKEWDQSHKAITQNTNTTRSSLLQSLKAGRIRGGILADSVGAITHISENPPTLRVNRAHRLGSVFAFPTGDLAFVLAHEQGHVQQAAGNWLQRTGFLMKYRFSRAFRAELEPGADAVACGDVTGATFMRQRC